MIGSLFSLLMSIPFIIEKEMMRNVGETLSLAWLGAMGCISLLIACLIPSITLLSLQREEQKVLPKLLELFQRDSFIKVAFPLLFLFPVVYFFLACSISIDLSYINDRFAIVASILLTGLFIDILIGYLKKHADYINPFKMATKIQNLVSFSAEKGEEGDLCNWIDVLTEMALKAIDRSSFVLVINVMPVFPLMIEKYVTTCIRREQHASEREVSRNKMNYLLFYVEEHLYTIYGRAIHKKIEWLCYAMITNVGKIVLSIAQYDCLFAGQIIRLIGKFGDKATQEGLEEINFKIDCLLIEIAKNLIEEISGPRVGLRDPFLHLIKYLEENATKTFKKNKKVKIAVLIKPFQDMKVLLQSPKIADHPDLSIIEKELERVILEYEALNQVMSRLPPATLPAGEQ